MLCPHLEAARKRGDSKDDATIISESFPFGQVGGYLAA